MRQRPPRLRVGRPVAPRIDPRVEQDRGTTHERGYGRHWQLLRLVVLNEEPTCRRCAGRGRVTAATLVDHILPLRDGGTNDRDNLQPLCVDCHAVKTHGDVGKRKRRSSSETASGINVAKRGQYPGGVA